jgi:argonaute-like protein implicated in RNA metabolism and viral defense
MSKAFLIGERLKTPSLRFNPSSLRAQHYDARKGLRIYGPYDANRLGKESIRCSVIYPRHLRREAQKLIDGLINGNGIFPGMKGLFRVSLEVIREREVEREVPSEIEQAISAVIQNDDPDIVVIIISSKNEEIYVKVKSLLLGNGIPSQVVTAEKLRDVQGFPWILENIALQIYAKIGGTPWTVASHNPKRELVIGISRAMDKKKNYVVGFITAFTHDGDYLFMYSLAPKPIKWDEPDEYRKGLANLIVNAYKEYERKVGKPSSIVIHLCKRPGKFREIESVETALQEIDIDLPYALLHLNDDTNYRLFDTTHPTYVPPAGIKVDIDPCTALLFLDGRVQEMRRKRGVPRVLEVHMDKRSTIPREDFPRLVRQVYEFSRVNWRGFNAQTIPATLGYSYLIARLVSEIGADNWNYVASAGRLRDKAWFL